MCYGDITFLHYIRYYRFYLNFAREGHSFCRFVCYIGRKLNFIDVLNINVNWHDINGFEQNESLK